MRKFFTVLFALSAFLSVGSLDAYADTVQVESTKKGDANNDGVVNVSDVVAAVNYILGINSADFVLTNADMDGDNTISVSDLVAMVNIILNGEETEPGGGDIQNPGTKS